jgi:hypothetical protein
MTDAGGAAGDSTAGTTPGSRGERWVAAAGEALVVRFSFCCGREGCRRRTTPPSLRFLGRRVYLEAVVLVASVIAVVRGAGRVTGRDVGVAPRTLRRWLGWWQGAFLKTIEFVTLAAALGLSTTAARDTMPTALWVASPWSAPARTVGWLARWLAPLTTSALVRSSVVRVDL